MELTVKGNKGRDARLALSAEPAQNTTILLGEGVHANTIQQSAEFVKVGEFPFKEKVTFFFHTRPWAFSVQQENGQAFSTNSEDESLRTTMILTPDTVTLTLNYSVE